MGQSLVNKYETFIKKSIEDSGYILGKDLNLRIQKRFGLPADHARKLVQRIASKGTISSSAPVSFGNGQYAYYQSNSLLSKETILKITKEHRPPLYRILSLMDSNSGIISFYEIMKVAACPVKDSTTKGTVLSKIVYEVEQLDLGKAFEDHHGNKFLISKSEWVNSEKKMEEHMARMKTDVSFIPDILRSLQSYNLLAGSNTLYRSKATPSKGIIHNGFIWDAIGYSKTTGINPGLAIESVTEDKQTLVVVDILTYREYTDHDFQGFFSRIQAVINSVKYRKRKVLPIIVYGEIQTKKLYNTIHKLGLITIDLASIYGSNILKVITNLKSLRSESLPDQMNPSAIASMVEETLNTLRLAGQEENLKNIKGDLFEFLMYPFINSLFTNSSLQQGKKYSQKAETKEEYEYDYVVTVPNINEIIILELKGYLSSARIPLGDTDTKNSLQWFFGRTFPFARKILNQQVGNPKITACYITTAQFHPDAMEYLGSINKGKLKPTGLKVSYDGAELLQLLEERGLQKVKVIVEKYFIQDEVED